jgi:hypothetical protein
VAVIRVGDLEVCASFRDLDYQTSLPAPGQIFETHGRRVKAAAR